MDPIRNASSEDANRRSWPHWSLGSYTRLLVPMLILAALLAVSSADDQPRQSFKVYSSPRSSSLAKVQSLKQQGSNSSSNKRRAITNDGDGQLKLNKQQKPAISNATLKKLLNQSLLNKSNKLNDTNGASKTNFKFVFIQRAAVAPSNSSNVEYSKKTGTVSPQSSLAASVSKQLASSLLTSASSLVGSSVVAAASNSPSITALASQIVSRTVDSKGNTTSSTTTSTTTTEKNLVDSGVNSNSSESKDDLKRITTAKASGGKAGSKRNKSRPSKVYNLPVKFVTNGQPTHLVFNTIRQHFATIKKLQAATSVGYKAANDSRRRKPGQGKFSKGNSRLIYLPLRYLSNAKPNRIITSKVRH